MRLPLRKEGHQMSNGTGSNPEIQKPAPASPEVSKTEVNTPDSAEGAKNNALAQHAEDILKSGNSRDALTCLASKTDTAKEKEEERSTATDSATTGGGEVTGDGTEVPTTEEGGDKPEGEKELTPEQKKLNKRKNIIQGINSVMTLGSEPSEQKYQAYIDSIKTTTTTESDYKNLIPEEHQDQIAGMKAAISLSKYNKDLLKTGEGRRIAQQIAKDPNPPKDITKEYFEQKKKEAKELHEARIKGVSITKDLINKKISIDSKATDEDYKKLLQEHYKSEELTPQELESHIEGMRAAATLNEIRPNILKNEIGEKLAQEVAANPNLLDPDFLKKKIEEIEEAEKNGEKVENDSIWAILLALLLAIAQEAVEGASKK